LPKCHWPTYPWLEQCQLECDIYQASLDELPVMNIRVL
jgi:hypothetical protein